MKNYLFLILLFCLYFQPTFAQHEADNWYFGYYSGISFKGGTPSALSDGQLYTFEGCAAISDKTTGELLFYTDGVTIWNSQHKVMNNGIGLNGGSSSTQSALIVPNPANKLQYFVFTSPDLTNGGTPTTTSAYYSIVSMEVPLGTVISKNNFLIDSVAEKLTGTIDCDGTGFWVVTHHVRKSCFYSFHVTAMGVEKSPVTSQYLTDTKSFGVGYMKIAPNSSKIALASTRDEQDVISCLSLFDFDASTGQVTNYMRLNDDVHKDTFYGVAFSQDNTKLYATVQALSKVFQYDLALSDAASIRDSVVALGGNQAIGGGIQLAPDGKIYIVQSSYNNTHIGTIDKPNLKGTDCGYRGNALQLSKHSIGGLPNFMDYIFNNTGTFPGCAIPLAVALPDSVCIGSNLTFTDLSTHRPSRREWTFENGMPPTSSDSIVSVSYSKVGTHRVRLVVGNNNGSDTTYTEAIIFPIPTAIAGADTTICMGEAVQIGANSEPGNTYSWQPAVGLSDASVSNPTASPIQSTEYILTVKNTNVCINHDTIQIGVNTPDEHLFTLTPSTVTIYPGEEFQTSLNVPNGIQSWKVHLGYDDLIVRYNSIVQTTNGIIATDKEQKGQIMISGSGDSGDVVLSFTAFLPTSFDTTFAMTLANDSLESQSCGTIATHGCTLELGEFCARKFRIIKSTGKNYFLNSKANEINIGVGLSGRVRLELYDYTGTLKKVLTDSELEAGEYSLDFDLPTGLYYCRMNAGMYNDVQKIMIFEK